MKTLYSLFLLAFFVFQVQSKPKPPAKPGQNDYELQEFANLQEDGKNLKDEAEAQFRGLREPCFQKRGYCLPRIFACNSGFVFKEQYNTCSEKKLYKCCLH